MAGLNPINNLNITSSINWAISNTQNSLTAQTRAKLHALGINTERIRTEEEGLKALRMANLRRSQETNQAAFKPKTQSDSLTNQIATNLKLLLNDLGLSIDPNEDYYKTIYRIKNKISELKTQAGDDKSKLAKITDYISRYELIESMAKSQIDLNTTMNLTANFNMAYHSLIF